MDFLKGGGGGGGGATITDKKKINSQVQWQWAIMDHLQPWSRLPACIMAGELNILETNVKSEEIINFYLIFYRF